MNIQDLIAQKNDELKALGLSPTTEDTTFEPITEFNPKEIIGTPYIPRSGPQEETDWWVGFKNMAMRENPIAQLLQTPTAQYYDYIKDSIFNPKDTADFVNNHDPNFNIYNWINENNLQEHADFFPEFLNQRQAEARLDYIRKQEEQLMQISRSPYSAQLLGGLVGGGLLNPFSYIGGLAGGAIRGSLFKRALVGGSINAGVQSVTELALQGEDPTRTLNESINNMLGAFIFGGAISAVTGKVSTKVSNKPEPSLNAKTPVDINKTEVPVDDNIIVTGDEGLDNARVKEVIDSINKYQAEDNTFTLKPDDADAEWNAKFDASIQEDGSTSSIDSFIDWASDDSKLADTNWFFKAARKLNGMMSDTYKGFSSEFATVREFTNKLATRTVKLEGELKGQITPVSVDERMKALEFRPLPTLETLEAKYKELKLSGVIVNKDDFYKGLVKDILTDNTHTGLAARDQASNAVITYLKELFEHEKSLGLISRTDFKRLGENYLPQVWNKDQILTTQFEKQFLEDFRLLQSRYTQNATKMSKEFEDVINQAYKQDKNLFNYILSSDKAAELGFDLNTSNMIKAVGAKDLDDLVTNLNVYRDSLTKELLSMYQSARTRLLNSNGKDRLSDFIIAHTAPIHGVPGNQLGELGGVFKQRTFPFRSSAYIDYLDTDLSTILQSYTRQVNLNESLIRSYGTANLTEIAESFKTKLQAEFNQRLEDIRQKGITDKALGEQIVKLNNEAAWAARHIDESLLILTGRYGRQFDPQGTLMSGLRMMSNAMDVSFLSGVSLSMMPDIAGGWIYKTFQPLKTNVLDIAGSLKAAGLSKEELYMFGLGGQTSMTRLVDDISNVAPSENFGRSKLEQGIAKFGRFTRRALGSAFLDDTSKAMVFKSDLFNTIKSAQDWIKTGSIDDATKQKLAFLGIDKKRAAKIAKSVEKYQQWNPEANMYDPRIDLWSPELKDVMIKVRKNTERYIISNDPYNNFKASNSPLGRFFTKYLNFLPNSINKRLLPSLQDGGIQAYTVMAAQIATATVVTTAKLAISGNLDMIEKDPERFFLIVLSSSGALGYMTNFTQLIQDLNNTNTRVEDMFSKQIPIFGYLNSLKSAGDIALGRGTEQDIKAALGVLPWSNAFGMGSVFKNNLSPVIYQSLGDYTADKQDLQQPR